MARRVAEQAVKCGLGLRGRKLECEQLLVQGKRQPLGNGSVGFGHESVRRLPVAPERTNVDRAPGEHAPDGVGRRLAAWSKVVFCPQSGLHWAVVVG